MAKRSASMQLTCETWDEVEEKEEAGFFQLASEEELNNRVMKKAKRRDPTTKGGEKPGAFSSFAGFTSKTTAETMNFGSIVNSNNGINNKPLFTSNGLGINSAPVDSKSTLNSQKSQMQDSAASTPKSSQSSQMQDSAISSPKSSQRSPEFYLHLRDLNEAVASWISLHVKQNGLCVLTPVFKDYERYYSRLEAEYPFIEDNQGSKDLGDNETESLSNSDGSSKKNAKESPVNSSPEPSSTALSFSCATSSPIATTSSVFKPESGLFSKSIFGGSSNSSGFSFSTSNQSTSESKEEEEYVPPQPEINLIVEKDAFFQKRCKLFYKKEGSFVDKGIGMLYLKPLNKKTQLLIRADTSLGNILLNIFLDPSLNPQKSGANNVLLYCIANPPINPKEPKEIATFLIRVKTEDDAVELLKQINDNKT